MNKYNRHKLSLRILIISTILFIICFSYGLVLTAIPLLIIGAICFFVGAISFFYYIFSTESTEEELKRHAEEDKLDQILRFCETYKTNLENADYKNFLSKINGKTLYCNDGSPIVFKEKELSLPTKYINTTIQYQNLTNAYIQKNHYANNNYEVRVHYRGQEAYGSINNLKHRTTSVAEKLEFDYDHAEQAKQFYCIIKDIVALRNNLRERSKLSFYKKIKENEKKYLDYGDEDIKLFLKDKNYKIIKCTCSEKEEIQENLFNSDVFDMVYIEPEYEKNKFIVLNKYLDELGKFSMRETKKIGIPEYQIPDLECYIYSLEFDENDNYVCSVVLILEN